MKVMLLTLFFGGLIYWQVRGIIKNKQWKGLLVYSLLMGVGMLYSYGIVLNLPLPSPTKILADLFRPIYDYIFNILLG